MPSSEEYDDRREPELMVAFVVVESRGGPYEDRAFAAGFQIGDLAHTLSSRAVVAGTRMIYTDLVRQADLIAMHFGYQTDVLAELDDGWTHLGYKRNNLHTSEGL